MGAGALAGTTFAINRERLARNWDSRASPATAWT